MGMLVLSRYPNTPRDLLELECADGTKIAVRILEVFDDGKGVKVGIAAPQTCAIYRSEVPKSRRKRPQAAREVRIFRVRVANGGGGENGKGGET